MREWHFDCSGTVRGLLRRLERLRPARHRLRGDRANIETTIADLLSGQHSDPLRVIRFNPETNRSEDVSHAIAQEILRRLGLEGRSVPSALEDFNDRHVGRIVS